MISEIAQSNKYSFISLCLYIKRLADVDLIVLQNLKLRLYLIHPYLARGRSQTVGENTKQQMFDDLAV